MGMLLLGMSGLALATLAFQFLCYLTHPRGQGH
jgi:hypothetical protein